MAWLPSRGSVQKHRHLGRASGFVSAALKKGVGAFTVLVETRESSRQKPRVFVRADRDVGPAPGRIMSSWSCPCVVLFMLQISVVWSLPQEAHSSTVRVSRPKVRSVGRG